MQTMLFFVNLWNFAEFAEQAVQAEHLPSRPLITLLSATRPPPAYFMPAVYPLRASYTHIAACPALTFPCHSTVASCPMAISGFTAP